MALAGHDTPVLVFNDPSTASSYSGTLNSVTAGELIVVCLAIDGNSNTQDPSAYTVTLGSDTLTFRSGGTTTLVEGFAATFSVVATASGNPTLSVTTPNSCRAMSANAFKITGFDTTTPHPNASQNQPGANATALTSPNAVSTAANGNAIIGVISIHGGDVTNLAVAGADGSSTGQTGSSAFNDNEWGVAWKRTPTAAAVSFAWTWTTSDRPGAAWVEIAEATGSGITGTGAVTTAATTASGTGTVSISGTGAVTAAAATVSGTGTVSISGTGAVTTAAATVSGTGAVGSDISGSGAVTTGPATVSGSGVVSITGTGAVTTGAATAGGTGTVGELITGSGAVTTGAVTVSGTGSVTISGTASVTISAPTVSGSGTVAEMVTGTGSVTIGAVTISGSEIPAGTSGPASHKTGGAIVIRRTGGGIVANETGGYIVQMRSGGEI